MRLAELHPRRFFLETWRRLDEEAAAERATMGDTYDTRPLVAMIVSAVGLTLAVYWGNPGTLLDLYRLLDPQPGSLLHALRYDPLTGGRSAWWGLTLHGYWAVWRVLGYLVIPMIAIKLSGAKVRDHGFATAGTGSYAWVYLLSYLVVFGCVLGIAGLGAPGFFETYPFYKPRDGGWSWASLLLWEALYVAQFFALEFFFRGYWLETLRRAMGSHAIFVMMVPYVMIHHPGKPLPETLGAIFAGIFLGTLAMKTRSIWGGFLVHVGVAVSMDVTALFHERIVPTSLMPP